MKLKRTANTPHRGQGEFGRVRTKRGQSGGFGGEHLTQRDHSGFDDARGYRGSRTPKLKDSNAGSYAGADGGRAAGFPGMKSEQRTLDSERYDSERRNGQHTGKPSRNDTRLRNGPEGLGKGSPPPGVGKGKWVRGTPESHLGTAGRGDSGRRGKSDNYKGKPTDASENPSHEWFEKLGAG